jgi:hypothetical protein
MKLFLALLSGVFLVVGCGGSEARVGSSGPDGGPAEGGDLGATRDGGPDAPTTPGADGGDGGDAKAKDTRIDPVELGRSWTYDVKVRGIFPACDDGTFAATAVSQSTIEGRTALHVESFCQGAGAYDYAIDGDRVYSYVTGAWRTSLDAPVTEGHQWTDGFLTYRWESKGTVTTPAGTFSDCWSATTVASYSSYIVLCRGVGPVRWHYDTGLGNGYDATLVATSF